MLRRTLLQWIAALVAMRPFAGLRLAAQSPAFSIADTGTLKAIAEVALPSAIGQKGRDLAVERFMAWHVNYRPGAERGYGYGSSTLSAPTGPAPAVRYAAQFAALQKAAQDQGAASFAALALDKRRALIEGSLTEPQRVTQMPARPTGANLVADVMGFYFNGADANDLCYNAAIGRDSCRSLDGSDQPPTPLGAR